MVFASGVVNKELGPMMEADAAHPLHPFIHDISMESCSMLGNYLVQIRPPINLLSEFLCKMFIALSC